MLGTDEAVAEDIPNSIPLSKNQQKKLKRKQEWEDGRDARKARRKEKTKEKRSRKRQEQTVFNSLNEESAGVLAEKPSPSIPAVQVPVSIIFDCQYDNLMKEGELASLASQLTRLKERFEGVLAKHHESWKNVKFLKESYSDVAKQAALQMHGKYGGEILGPLKSLEAGDILGQKAVDNAEVDSDVREGEIVYLSSDSPNTLNKLRPYSTYIIGGLVDRNRYKGVCYKNAISTNVKTAKLPIDELMQMRSRQVLATNHVAEILLRWLETGDWAVAFTEVIPKRKGGSLRTLAQGENVKSVSRNSASPVITLEQEVEN